MASNTHERSRASEEGGFTLIEVLVVSVILVSGMLAAFLLLDSGAQATNNSSQRDGANGLAEEFVERALGVRYDSNYNDLVDRRASSPAAGVLNGSPAERFRAALAPDAATAPITDSDPSRPWASVSSWDIVRGNTTYRVSYRACTDSDTVDGVRVDGPYDCARQGTCDPVVQKCPCPTNATSCTPTTPDCQIGLIDPATYQQGSDPLDVRLQLLGTVGLQLCLTSSSTPLTPLATGLCALLNNSGTGGLANLVGGLTSKDGILASLQNIVGLNLLGANVNLCPGALESTTSGLPPTIASSTRLEVTVSWTERSTGRSRSIRQQSVVRRPAV